MKKFFSLLLAVVLVFCCFGVCSVSAEEDTALINSLYKLQTAQKENEEFTVD